MKTPKLFDKVVARRPDYYPQATTFLDAIHTGFWTHQKWSMLSAAADFRQRLNPEEQRLATTSFSAIAQLELPIKEFWAGIGKIFPHPSISNLGIGIANSECYSSDTEVLTPSGWKLLTSMQVGDDVYQYEEGELVPVKVQSTINKNYEGPMYQLGDTRNKALVTPRHDLVAFNKKGKLKRIPAEEFKFHNDNLIPKRAVQRETAAPQGLSTLERLYIAVQADATVNYGYGGPRKKYLRGGKGGYNVTFNLKKTRKLARLKGILEELAIPFLHYVKNNGEQEYRIYLENPLLYKRLDWVFSEKRSTLWYKEFIEEALQWDGTTKGKLVYYTAEETLADTVQAVAVLAGYEASKSRYSDNRPNHRDKWEVALTTNGAANRGALDLPHKVVQYKGVVSCITVPSGVILTRRQGRTFIAGNCVHGSTYEKVLNVLGLIEAYEKNLDVEAFQNRLRYLSKYSERVYEGDRKQAVYSLILFDTFSERTTLFSQFYTLAGLSLSKNIFQELDAALAYTTMEETIHYEVAAWLVNTLRVEYPELFDDELRNRILHEADEAFAAEQRLVDFILQDYDNGDETRPINAAALKLFVYDRIREGLAGMGFHWDPLEMSDDEKDTLVAAKGWFDDWLHLPRQTDFFVTAPVEYAISNKSFEEDDVFA